MESGRHRRSLHESEALYRLLVESSQQLMALLDCAGRLVYASPAFERYFGELRAFPLDHVHHDHREALRRTLAECALGERRTSVVRHLHGRGTYLECTASGVSFEGASHVLAVLREVSDREGADETRQAHLRCLETLERVSRAIHDADEIDVMLSAALSALLDGMACDSAWLLQPAPVGTHTFRLLAQRTRPEWQSAVACGVDLPLEARAAAALGELLVADQAVRYGPGGREVADLPAVHAHVRTAMTVPLHPLPRRSYLLGVHRCAHGRAWTESEGQLLAQSAVRLASALRSLFTLGDLRESESKLASAERLAGVGYWDLDLVDDRYSWSEEAGRIFGRAFERPITRAASREFVHPADRDAIRRESELAMASGRPFEMEFRIARPDGEVRVVHSRGDVLRDQSGRPRSFFGTIQDVTERRLADDRLRASEREFRTTFELAAVGQAQADPATGRLLLVNRKLCELLGYTEAELLARNFAELTHPEDRERELSLFQRMVTGEIPELVLEKRMIRKDGTEVWVRITASLIRDDDGRPLRAVAIGEDVTLRRRAEQALLESHALLNAVIEGTSDAIFVKDAAGRYLLINSAGARILGRSVGDVLGQDDRALFSPETASSIMAHDQRVLASGGSLTSEEVGTAAGMTRTYLSTKSVRRDERGQPIGLIGIARDITDLKQLEEQFRQAQKMEAIGRLAGGVAHDFNNLLTVINGNADLVALDIKGNAEGAELLSEIQAAGRRAANLTSQLLSFSRKQILQPQLVNLNILLEALWKMLLRLIGEDVELTFDAATDLGWAQVDPGQFEQAIVNLVVNARDAMPNGGRLTIETSNLDLDEAYVAQHPEARPGRYVRVAVTDTGAGMDTDTRTRIFEPFFTTKDRGKGTGLGLPMVYGFVRQSGGHVEVETERGSGTTIELYLPRADGAASVTRGATESVPAAGGSETILLVEDESSVRNLVARVLRGKGYRVLAAATGEEALRMASEYAGRIDLLLTDLVMPRMNGRELALTLMERRTEMRTLFMSGYTDETVMRQVEDPSACFLQKPFSPTALAEKVRGVLETVAPPGVGGAYSPLGQSRIQ